ncbi:MAG: phosphoribosylformylglycinamidine synthase subunit PurS [Candidatus Sumerlaeia bacterium]|nr:phosphoribosylformylglycinamidine synthase subunit PurS [Candidatus Sumerlaeia bacterium]
MRIHVLVHLRKDILDIQGQAIQEALVHAGHSVAKKIRVGKSFYLDVDGNDVDAVRPQVEELCKKVLSNPLLEDYSWEVVPA